jgi:hypothetical protein
MLWRRQRADDQGSSRGFPMSPICRMSPNACRRRMPPNASRRTNSHVAEVQTSPKPETRPA